MKEPTPKKEKEKTHLFIALEVIIFFLTANFGPFLALPIIREWTRLFKTLARDINQYQILVKLSIINLQTPIIPFY